MVEYTSNGIGLSHVSAESAWLLARSAGFWRCPGLNCVKPSAGHDEPVSAATGGGPADAAKFQNTPIAEPAAAGPT
jgi:hypothetical protein